MSYLISVFPQLLSGATITLQLFSLTLVFSIPMIIFGLYGMNVGGLWFDGSPYFAIGVTVLLMIGMAVWFIRKKML